jgi:heme-degrading monooxygenase HmoA
MHARITRLDLDPARLDEAVGQLESEGVPRFKELDGFKGLTFVGDRDSGRVVAVGFWESEEKLEASAEAVQEVRQQVAETGGASGEPAVEKYEVLLDVMV